ncbi:MAG TPA: thioredoxin domain-containing protein [Anaerolineaceae bacterium]|nr:thioredoxin domain-containing protein [Anaerolineaceae bacterium]
MRELREVTEADFENRVLGSAVPVLVEFSAVWCGPCKMLEPILCQLEEELAGRLRIVKIDVDVSVRTAMKYQVAAVPTLILFTKGEAEEQWSGYQTRERIVARLVRHSI